MDNLAFVHGGNIYEVKRRYKREIVDFSANINPLGLPLRIKEAIYRHFDRILHYPDFKARDITQKIARYWGINEENVLLGNGSSELIYLIASTYKPKTSLITAPTFSEYERAAKSVKSKIQFLKLEEKESFRINPSYCCDKADVSFFCNPNNPTGNLIFEDSGSIERLTNKLLVIDEAFMDFLPDQKNYTLIWNAVRQRKLIVLRTFTKFFALPGLRMGYIIAHKENINKLRQYLPPWNTNSLGQLAVRLVLNDKKYINKTYKLIDKERKFLFEQLAKIKGLRPYPSVTNFLLIKIEKARMDSKSLQRLLLKKGILIRNCSNFRNLSEKYVRVAVRTHQENTKLLTALRNLLTPRRC